MERAATEIKPLAHQLSEPFTQHGSANVACIFELTDGQTISVFFIILIPRQKRYYDSGRA
ncbi:MAG: hypothetical protein D4R63_03340 [Methylococcaceae bacterium]|jgi:hypothetical protein|nr:MAG: hypothetical protein D4R63_03340 [Methylococcaceae bacterium]